VVGVLDGRARRTTRVGAGLLKLADCVQCGGERLLPREDERIPRERRELTVAALLHEDPAFCETSCARKYFRVVEGTPNERLGSERLLGTRVTRG
jgi:hypothetical protein